MFVQYIINVIVNSLNNHFEAKSSSAQIESTAIK